MKTSINKIIYNILFFYSHRPFLRTLVKFLPKGNAFDFYLTEKAKSIKMKDLTLPLRYPELVKGIKEGINKSQEFGTSIKVKIYPIFSPPVLHRLGSYKLDPDQKSRSKKFARIQQQKMRPNDPCAVLIKEPDWEDNPLYFNYHTLFYSDLLALRENNIKPIIISANGLVFSEEDRCLLIHRRSHESDEFPHTLHTFGGAFMPTDIGERGDISGLKECVIREIHEETGLSVTIPNNTPIAIIDEFAVDYVQVTFLGINVTFEQLKDLRNNWEGTITKIHFDHLLKRLNNFHEWTNTGWVDVVLWLALDTPNSLKPISFAGKSAKNLVERLLGNLTIQHPS